MRSTGYRHWISIQKQTGKLSDFDGHPTEWETVIRCRANYKMRRMDQATEANTLIALVAARWTIRFCRDYQIDATMRIVWEDTGRIFYISGAEDEDGRRREIVIDATEEK